MIVELPVHPWCQKCGEYIVGGKCVCSRESCPTWYPLFEHMSKEHGLTLLDDELQNIASKADESRMKARGGVSWILVNALRHLDNDQMLDLLEEIQKRTQQ